MSSGRGAASSSICPGAEFRGRSAEHSPAQSQRRTWSSHPCISAAGTGPGTASSSRTQLPHCRGSSVGKALGRGQCGPQGPHAAPPPPPKLCSQPLPGAHVPTSRCERAQSPVRWHSCFHSCVGVLPHAQGLGVRRGPRGQHWDWMDGAEVTAMRCSNAGL